MGLAISRRDPFIDNLFSFFSQENWQSVSDCKSIGGFLFSFYCSDYDNQQIFECWQKECKAFSKKECQELWLDQFPLLSTDDKMNYLCSIYKILQNNNFDKYFELTNTDPNFRSLDRTFKMVHYMKENDSGKAIDSFILLLKESSKDGPEKDKKIRELEEDKKNLEVYEQHANNLSNMMELNHK